MAKTCQYWFRLTLFNIAKKCYFEFFTVGPCEHVESYDSDDGPVYVNLGDGEESEKGKYFDRTKKTFY